MESTNTADGVAHAECHQRLGAHLNFSTRDKNGSIQKKGVHMLNVWMLPDPKFNIRPTVVSSEDRDAKL